MRATQVKMFSIREKSDGGDHPFFRACFEQQACSSRMNRGERLLERIQHKHF
jgi:hypothetical protein